jgi:hypothetical protein
MFDHYLMTRFNLRNPKWETTKNNETLLTEEWMDDRMQLFANYCFPSVAAQTCKNFKWLLYFDTTTPDKYRQQVEQLVSGHPNIEVFYIDGMPSFYPAIQKYIEKRSDKIPYLITSRIDNDDVIHRDFIATVQKAFKSQSYMLVDIIKGYSLQIKPTVMLGKKEHIFNPFLSLIEKNVNPQTVWFNDHNIWKKERRIHQIRNKRLWIAIIHEKNKVNNFNGYDNVSWESLRDDFVVSDESSRFIIENMVPHKEWLKLSIRNKIIVKYKVLSKSIKKALGIYKYKK